MARRVGDYVKCSACEEVSPEEEWSEVDESEVDVDDFGFSASDIGGPGTFECPQCGTHEYIQDWDF